MSKILKTLKAKALDFGLKFLSIDEKIAYIAFNTRPSNVNPIVILPTTESTVKKIKQKMISPKPIGNIYNGSIQGIPVSMIRAGVGGPHVAMVMEGLKRSPCKMAIRVDYCGGLRTIDNTLDIADVIIPKEVFLTDGTSHSYIQTYNDRLTDLSLQSYTIQTEESNPNHMLYPSYQGKYLSIAPETTLNDALWDHVKHQNYDFKIKPGKLWSVDALFCETESAINTWISYGVNSVDMESSIVYFLGKLFDIPTISILGISDLPDTVEWNLQKTNKIHPKYEFILDNIVEVLVEALPNLRTKVIS